MATPAPGSILLGTTRPAELRDWYCRVLAPEHKGDGPIDLGGFMLVIDQRDDVDVKNNEPGRMILNFHDSERTDSEKGTARPRAGPPIERFTRACATESAPR
jgi:hypothetical protein